MELRVDSVGPRILHANGDEYAPMEYNPALIIGLEGDLGDGETFTCDDGCTVTRHGDEMTWFTPAAANRRGR